MNVKNNFLKKPIPVIFGVKSFELNKKEKRLQALKGVVPSILEFGDECKLCSRFDPEECACGGTGVEPELVEIEKDHFVRINLDILK